MRLPEAWNGSLTRTAYYMYNLDLDEPEEGYDRYLSLSVQDLTWGTHEEYLIEVDNFEGKFMELTPLDTTVCHSLGELEEVLFRRGSLEINKAYWKPDDDESYVDYRNRKLQRYARLLELKAERGEE